MAPCRYALLIGSSEPGMQEDIRVASEALRWCGFLMLKATDVSPTTMREMLLNFVRKISPDDIGLVYFSGHGQADIAENIYLQPNDTTIPMTEWLSLSTIVSILRAKSNSFNMIVMDCCRRIFPIDKPTKPNIPDEGMFLAFAAGIGRPAESNLIPNVSTFTYYLKKVLRDMHDQRMHQDFKEEYHHETFEKVIVHVKANQTVDANPHTLGDRIHPFCFIHKSLGTAQQVVQ